MTTARPRPRPPLKTQEAYNAAVQLYNQEFRTLGERTTAFLIVQSILVAAFVTVLIIPAPTIEETLPYAFYLVLIGIIVVGILFCVLYYLAGRSGAQAAFRWRQYMLYIEHNQQDTPWNWVYNYCDEEHKKHGEPPQKRKVYTWLRNLFTRLQCERCLLERPPLPSAWLFSPAIFLMVWASAIIYIVLSYMPQRGFPWDSAPTLAISIFIFLIFFFIIIWRCTVWWKTRRN